MSHEAQEKAVAHCPTLRKQVMFPSLLSLLEARTMSYSMCVGWGEERGVESTKFEKKKKRERK